MDHRCLTDELVSINEKAAVLSQLDIPWLRQPTEAQLITQADELHHQWLSFNIELRQGKLKHLKYDIRTKKLAWRRPKTNKDKTVVKFKAKGVGEGNPVKRISDKVVKKGGLVKKNKKKTTYEG